MSGTFQKTLVYLGLVEEPEEMPDRPLDYDDAAPRRRRAGRAPEGEPVMYEPADDPMSREPVRRAEPGDAEVRVLSLRDDEGSVRALRPVETPEAHVRVGEGVRAAVARIGGFDDVQSVVLRLRAGQPVLLDLTAVNGPTGQRVLDFIGGATFALGGRMESFGRKAILALPDGGPVPPEERERLAALGYAGAPA